MEQFARIGIDVARIHNEWYVLVVKGMFGGGPQKTTEIFSQFQSVQYVQQDMLVQSCNRVYGCLNSKKKENQKKFLEITLRLLLFGICFLIVAADVVDKKIQKNKEENTKENMKKTSVI